MVWCGRRTSERASESALAPSPRAVKMPVAPEGSEAGRGKILKLGRKREREDGMTELLNGTKEGKRGKEGRKEGKG